MMECYYLQSLGEIEPARRALQKFDSMLEQVSSSPIDREKLVANSADLARLAAVAGDLAEAKAQLAKGESRFQTHFDQLPAGSFDRVQARVRWLDLESRALFAMRDWSEVARVTRLELTSIDEGLNQKAGESELLLRRAVAQGYLGMALIRQGNSREAVAILQESVSGYRNAGPSAAFADDRDAFAAMAAEALAGALADTGDISQARSLLERTLALRESRLAKEPDSWELKESLASCLVLYAEVLIPSNADDAARRQALLARAEGLLNRPQTERHPTLDTTELKARINALRTAASKAKDADSREATK